MTTIIARPGLLFADTQCTTLSGCEYQSKIFKAPARRQSPIDYWQDGFWAVSGDAGGRTLLVSLLRATKFLEQLALSFREKAKGIDASALWCLRDRVWYLDTDAVLQSFTEWTAIGSGSPYAKAYLHTEKWGGSDGYRALGMLAMNVAKDLDPYTGGETEERLVT